MLSFKCRSQHHHSVTLDEGSPAVLIPREKGQRGNIEEKVILSRLQGEFQKSKQTGHELDSLTGTMHVIQDMLGRSLPGPLPPEQLSSAPSGAASAAAIMDLLNLNFEILKPLSHPILTRSEKSGPCMR